MPKSNSSSTPASEARPTAEWRARAARGEVTEGDFARLIDHTILKAEATPAAVERLCDEAVRYGFGAVCVNSAYVPLAAARLRGTGIKVCSVVGFPLGAMAPEVKAFEARWAVEHGAAEVDMVLAVGRLKAGDDAVVAADIRGVVAAAAGAAIKVIIEACYLTDEEKERACRLAAEAGADFVKTSTGFGPSGATAADVALMRRTVGEKLGVKAAGGIRDLATALAMLAAGADRLGMSAGVAVIEELRARARTP